MRTAWRARVSWNVLTDGRNCVETADGQGRSDEIRRDQGDQWRSVEISGDRAWVETAVIRRRPWKEGDAGRCEEMRGDRTWVETAVISRGEGHGRREVRGDARRCGEMRGDRTWEETAVISSTLSISMSSQDERMATAYAASSEPAYLCKGEQQAADVVGRTS